DLKYIEIPHSVNEVRKERYAHRIESILQYALCKNICRERMLLSYFGEKTVDDCGTCDICQEREKSAFSPARFEEITKSIVSILMKQPLGINELVDKLPYPQEQIVETVRYLVDENFLKEKDQKYFKR
ncbi:MAG: RecQ family zinc-binding domain-containing protein, partial [Porphyromonadaceae bacterium]|nr:RecQ family zinc-binding domain-containing protein [Porphyromonadaceae bacterium]